MFKDRHIKFNKYYNLFYWGRVKIARLEEIRDNNEKRYEEKSIELAKLSEKLAEVHNECSQQMERAKERSELLKFSMQNEISELEKQLAQSRAIANSAKRERDDVSSIVIFKLIYIC